MLVVVISYLKFNKVGVTSVYARKVQILRCQILLANSGKLPIIAYNAQWSTYYTRLALLRFLYSVTDIWRASKLYKPIRGCLLRNDDFFTCRLNRQVCQTNQTVVADASDQILLGIGVVFNHLNRLTRKALVLFNNPNICG